MLIDRGSLSQTVDAINAAQCDGRTLAAAERGEVAQWSAARQGLPGALHIPVPASERAAISHLRAPPT